MDANRALRVLIIDPDPAAREVLGALLSFDCCRVRAVADGASGLSAAEDVRPDVVLLDVAVPDVDGFDLCRQLARRRCRVVIVTARSSMGDRRAGRRAGAHGYLVKPFSPLELLRLIGVDEALEVAV